MSSGLVIELASFSMVPGVAEHELLAASERLEREFLSSAPGYLGRALSKLEDDTWMDVALWASEEDANAILSRLPENAAAGAYFSFMHGASLTHLHAVRRFGAFAQL